MDEALQFCEAFIGFLATKNMPSHEAVSALTVTVVCFWFVKPYLWTSVWFARVLSVSQVSNLFICEHLNKQYAVDVVRYLVYFMYCSSYVWRFDGTQDFGFCSYPLLCGTPCWHGMLITIGAVKTYRLVFQSVQLLYNRWYSSFLQATSPLFCCCLLLEHSITDNSCNRRSQRGFIKVVSSIVSLGD